MNLINFLDRLTHETEACVNNCVNTQYKCETATCYSKKKKKGEEDETRNKVRMGYKEYQETFIMESCLQWIQWNETLFSVDSDSPFLCSFRVKWRKKLKPQRKPKRDEKCYKIKEGKKTTSVVQEWNKID